MSLDSRPLAAPDEGARIAASPDKDLTKDMEFGDDLFQDSTQKLPNTRIDGRLDELRRGGCNQ
jgi:hypothetical protein